MELRYRRKMKMPVWSLPGFETGFEGGQVYGGESTMYDDALGTKRYGFAQSIPQLSQPAAPNINIGDINAQMNQQKQINWSSDSIPLQQQNNGNIFGPNNQEIWNKSADFTKNTALINGVQQKAFSSAHGNGGGGGNVGNIAASAVQFLGATANSFGGVQNANEMSAHSGQSTGYGAGYTYAKQNNIDAAREIAEVKKENTANTLKTTGAGVGLGASIGAAIGGVAGPIGAAAGAVLGLAIGLFGGANRKRKLRRAIYNAQQEVTRKNTFSNASAQTDYLTQNYYNKYGNPYDDQIYNAKYGKDADGWNLPDNSVKWKAIEFNRKLSLPNIK